MTENLCQFYTTNAAYILQNFEIPDDIVILEPFCGKGDLIKHLKNEIISYDLDPKEEYLSEKRDTLLDPPDYTSHFVITNPPYLANNKIKHPAFKKYSENDLYKCFLRSLIDTPCVGGILVLPVNFICSIKEINIRRDFLSIYTIKKLNIFEEQVFEDTTYSVCSFQFSLLENQDYQSIETRIYPSGKELSIKLVREENYTFGGEIYYFPQSKFKISRLLEGEEPNTDILLYAIDNKKKICLEINKEHYYGKISSRNKATITIFPRVNEAVQEFIVKDFNYILSTYREKYNSLFLTTYRERDRKRISFELVYKLISYTLSKFEYL